MKTSDVVGHTPGPWSVSDTGVCATTLNGHGNFYVASLPFPNEEPTKQDKANLRLIAAAPDMLQALLDVRKAHQDMFDAMPVAWQTFDHIVEQAIAKATQS